MNAIHLNSAGDIEEKFFVNTYEDAIIVIYDEYDQNRANSIAECFTEFDIFHSKSFASHIYPNLYILRGGFDKFFKEYQNLYEGTYIKDRDMNHVRNGDCLRAQREFIRDIKATKRSIVQRYRPTN